MLYLMYHMSVSSYGLLPLLLYLLLYIGICYHAAIAVVQYLVLYLLLGHLPNKVSPHVEDTP